jgi:hypothetical protein
MVEENHNHFGLAEILGNPYGLLGQTALALMGLQAAGLGGLPNRVNESPMMQDVKPIH